MSQNAEGGGFRSRSRKGRARSGAHGTGRGDNRGNGGENRGHGRSRRDGRKISDARGARGRDGARGGNGDHRGRRQSDEGHGTGRHRDYRGIDKARQAAFETLLKVTEDDAFGNLTLPGELRALGLKGRDAAFATEITYGTLRTLGVLDAVIDRCAAQGIESINPQVLDALRLGVYQLLYTRVEEHAAVDTSVRLVGATGRFKAKGFANGVLRTVTRTPAAEWLEQLTPADPLAALAFRTAHPAWIAKSFAKVLPEGELEAALEADSERPHVHLVARPGEISAEELALITGGEQGRYSPYAVYLPGGDPGTLEPVRQGLAGVQDEGSQLIARALTEVELEGEDTGRWLDLCAGPGGKAALAGAIARIEGAHVDAVETAAHRAKLVEKACRDLPVTVHVADGRDPGLEPGYDRVLVDAPCSGLGALRRRPEARWRKSEADIPGLSVLQFELLSSALKLVRPGGAVVYSTCSPDVRETRQVVERAVHELGAVELHAHGLVGGMTDVGEAPSVQMWPHRHGTDAMFFAVLRRR
ncbi:MFS transporter [Corynebacterium frankenforstense DSM 45800]|uniref:MFS transporter n=1 Tax=Corynebacterium frankenforstense DSM 45800 TaxID=1437875 RepID=A0A1L7CSI1_9CORY|nr:transcription antitermination factor NusB [Corynebacterium frankenforstense]APT88771.1 MFS transporter [Corynebacterium frankenforstense DSM 45800]